MFKLYMVKPDSFWGEGREAKRQAQLDLLSSLGLEENKDGFVVCSAEQAIELIHGNYCSQYDVKGCVQMIYSKEQDDSQFQTILSTCIDKMQNAAVELFNTKCQQEQPGINLHNVDQTMLLEDSCTDVLQEHLAFGWRILAIQPQPHQRRPDYILGRSGPKPQMSAQRPDINF